MRRLWLAVALLAVGCADEIPEDVTQQMEAARAATEPETDTTSGPDLDALLVTAPAGGYADWLADIRTGLDTIPGEAREDRGSAQHTVQELYARRFEPLRLFYGPGGAATAGPRLEQAVENVGLELQQLMRHLAGDTDDAAIAESVTASQTALDRVGDAARAAGLAPTAPRDIITTTGS